MLLGQNYHSVKLPILKCRQNSIDQFNPEQNLQVILQENSIAGEEAIFEEKVVWAYNLECYSEKVTVYLIPLSKFKGIPVKVFDKIKQIYDQKSSFRKALVNKKMSINKNAFLEVTNNEFMINFTSNGIDFKKFHQVVSEKEFFRSKAAIIKDIQQIKRDRSKTNTINNQVNELRIPNRMENTQKLLLVSKINKENMTNFSKNQEKSSLKDFEKADFHFSNKIIVDSQWQRRKTVSMRKGVTLSV